MAEKIVFLILMVVVLTSLWYFMGLPKPALRKVDAKQDDRQQDVTMQQEEALAVLAREEVVASPLIVRELNKGKVTMLVRYRARKQACTAHLIIWSGAKRNRIQDSYYDLGVIPGDTVTEEVIQSFMALAISRMEELQNAGRRTRKAKAEQKQQQEVVQQEVAVVVQPAIVPAVSVEDAVQPTVVVEDSPPESIRLRKFPSVYRGIITEIGMMPHNKGGEDFTVFGVRYRTSEGIEDAVFGANLRIAIREAQAGIGDKVEILKIGRKTVEAGKAPMNLFKVAKLEASV